LNYSSPPPVSRLFQHLLIQYDSILPQNAPTKPEFGKLKHYSIDYRSETISSQKEIKSESESEILSKII
jgi:hypothetical protein